jgi:ferredoxin-NADP reductase
MTSLGNIECTPLASLTFTDFTTGDILYLTGTAKNVLGAESHDIMPFQNAITLIHTTGFIFVRDALPLRQKSGTVNRPSPYSPPVRLLAEEASMSLFQGDDRPEANLANIKIWSPDVITFTWESSQELNILPGQAIILDCSPFLGARQYQHMASFNPISVNDDRIRTWTVSSASAGPTRSFAITLRLKPGGALTTAFFTIAQKLRERREELLDDTRPLNLTVKVAGITGSFTLHPPPPTLSPSFPTTRNFFWFAGGIGITPFLSLLTSLHETSNPDLKANIHLFLSARDASTLLPIIFEKYEGRTHRQVPLSQHKPRPNPSVHLTIDVLHSTYKPASFEEGDEDAVPQGLVLRQHAERLDEKFIREEIGGERWKENIDVYVCGPEEYATLVVDAVKRIGVDERRIRSEGFSY